MHVGLIPSGQNRVKIFFLVSGYNLNMCTFMDVTMTKLYRPHVRPQLTCILVSFLQMSAAIETKTKMRASFNLLNVALRTPAKNAGGFIITLVEQFMPVS